MKHLYLSILAFAAMNFAQAQTPTLTAASNEPNAGDSRSTKKHDSTTAVPKATGTGLNWNFTSLTQNTAAVAVRNFTTAAGVPQSSMFAGCNLVEQDLASGDNLFWKKTVSPTQFELLGINNPGTNSTINFTNSLIAIIWPATFGYNQTDQASGSATLAGMNGPANYTMNTQGTGTGTIMLPSGGGTLTNVLQTRSTSTLVIGLTGATLTIRATDYDYYHNSQKFPVLTVSYETQTVTPAFGQPTVTSSFDAKFNQALLTGINEKNFDATFQVFPNPAKDMFTVNLENTAQQQGTIQIYNGLGQVVKTISLGNDVAITRNIFINDLAPGIYIVKTSLGERKSARRLIVE